MTICLHFPIWTVPFVVKDRKQPQTKFESRRASSSSNRISCISKSRQICTDCFCRSLVLLGHRLTHSSVSLLSKRVYSSRSLLNLELQNHKALHCTFFLTSVILRLLEKDMSTSSFATLKRFSPWPFQTTSAPYWRLTWSATSMRRTLCLCPTLMRAWSTCRTVAAATPTPIMKATSINNSDSEGDIFPLL